MKKKHDFLSWEALNDIFMVPQTPAPADWEYLPEEWSSDFVPWNKGKKGVQDGAAVAKANSKRVWTPEMRKAHSERMKGVNKGRKRPDLAERNKRPRPDVAARNRKMNADKPRARGADGKFVKA